VAPTDTVLPGTRVSLALMGIVRDAAPRRPRPAAAGDDLGPDVVADMERLAGVIGTDLPAAVLFAVLLAWTQLFGLLSFEVFSQTRGVVTHHEAFFRDAAATMAARAGL
jgi:hypothetical protein